MRNWRSPREKSIPAARLWTYFGKVLSGKNAFEFRPCLFSGRECFDELFGLFEVVQLDDRAIQPHLRIGHAQESRNDEMGYGRSACRSQCRGALSPPTS